MLQVPTSRGYCGLLGVVPIQKSEKTIKVSQIKYHKRGPAVSALLSLNPTHPVVE
jgi:hypothetical protein